MRFACRWDCFPKPFEPELCSTVLSDAEQAALGFRIVAGGDLRLRPNMLASEYSAEDDPRSVLDLIVPADAGVFVEQAWNEDVRVDAAVK